MFALNRAAAIGAVCLGLLGATSAQAEVLTWSFGTGGATITTPAGVQPISFMEYDYLGDGHTMSVSAGLGEPAFFLGTDLIQSIDGLGVGPLDPAQIGAFEFIRIGLDSSINEVTSVTFRNATPFFDDYLILGSNDPNTLFGTATVIDGNFFGFGGNHSQTGPAEFEVSLRQPPQYRPLMRCQQQ